MMKSLNQEMFEQNRVKLCAVDGRQRLEVNLVISNLRDVLCRRASRLFMKAVLALRLAQRVTSTELSTEVTPRAVCEISDPNAVAIAGYRLWLYLVVICITGVVVAVMIFMYSSADE